MKKQIIAIAVAAFAVTACSDKQVPESRRVRVAPMSQEQTGVVVHGLSKSQLTDLLEADESLRVRVLNTKHGLYEIYGAGEAKVRELIDDEKVIVHGNKYVADKKRKGRFIPRLIKQQLDQELQLEGHPIVTLIERFQGVKLEGELLDFVSTCGIDRATEPLLDIRTNHQPHPDNGIVMELGASFYATTQGSRANDGSDNLRYLWLVTAPEHSALPPMAYGSDVIGYEPDALGPHTFSVIAKDARGVCNLAIGGFYVTTNDPYNPARGFDDSAADHITVNPFWHVFHVNAQQSWGISRGEGVIIAVIDTGVDYNHPAITRNMAINYNEIPGNNVDDDNNGFVDDVVGYDFGMDDGYPFDDFGHGTHVAGIAASNVFGAARSARILALKYSAGFGSDMASIAASILYSVDRGAHVINMSLGWPDNVPVIEATMKYAEANNVLVVVASGNGDDHGIGYSIDATPSYPASYPLSNVIAVASSDENDVLTTYSNFGHSVHVAAPGGTGELPIVSAFMKNPYGDHAEYVGFTGTSMAAPLVAGVTAQLLAVGGNLLPWQIRDVLMNTSRSVPNMQGLIGAGVIDAAAALHVLTAAGLQ